MCWNRYLYTLLGIFLGASLLLTGGYFGARSLLVVETESPFDFETTVNTIIDEAKKINWKVPKTYRLCKSLAMDGYSVPPVAVIELCQPEYAGELLKDDNTRLVSSFMPCRISVYTRTDGKVVVSRMNTGLVSRLFRGKVAEVMSKATEETKTILELALQKP